MPLSVNPLLLYVRIAQASLVIIKNKHLFLDTGTFCMKVFPFSAVEWILKLRKLRVLLHLLPGKQFYYEAVASFSYNFIRSSQTKSINPVIKQTFIGWK